MNAIDTDATASDLLFKLHQSGNIDIWLLMRASLAAAFVICLLSIPFVAATSFFLGLSISVNQSNEAWNVLRSGLDRDPIYYSTYERRNGRMVLRELAQEAIRRMDAKDNEIQSLHEDRESLEDTVFALEQIIVNLDGDTLCENPNVTCTDSGLYVDRDMDDPLKVHIDYHRDGTVRSIYARPFDHPMY